MIPLLVVLAVAVMASPAGAAVPTRGGWDPGAQDTVMRSGVMPGLPGAGFAGDRALTDIGDVVRSAANLISHQKRGNRISIGVHIAPDLPIVNADGGQIQQAVIALATNAIDTMPDGGKLIFCVTEHGNRILTAIVDTGMGIPPEDMSKIFEPFFTTKEVGKGTGLGLSVCYGIISEHGGRISVRSNVGSGTTFSIFLPGISE